jgi:hypothetical protein
MELLLGGSSDRGFFCDSMSEFIERGRLSY